ncbi:MAG: MerC domain-containing protein [Ferruginibacter sp.]
MMNIKLNWDALGIATSIACAIHCALLPVVLSTLPVFGINIIHNLFFEWGMIALAFVVGSYSLFHGYIKHHRSLTPVLIFSAGFVFLVLKQFFTQHEIPFLILAVALIISAHFYNYRICHKSKCASPHHKH